MDTDKKDSPSDEAVFDICIYREDKTQAEIRRKLQELSLDYQLHEGHIRCDCPEQLDAERYLQAKRGCCADEYLKDNRAFAQRHLGEDYEERTRYMSRYSPTMILRVTPEEYERIAADPEVQNVTRVKDGRTKPMGNDILSQQIKTNITSDEMGIRGRGVTIGAISAGNITYESNSPQLAPLINKSLITLLVNPDKPPSKSYHSTVILSQLIGVSVTIDEITYGGVVQDAILYIAPTITVFDVYAAIETLLDFGVNVINYSAGEIIPTPDYDDFDRQIDILISTQGFTFVTVSGNSTIVTSPGKAYNAITVGNVQTKSGGNTALPPPYEMFCYRNLCSGYLQDAYLTNKPDLVAPGVFIPYVVSRNEVLFDNVAGTSFAAPYVTGVVAQIMQISPLTKVNPLLAKAFLLLGANNALVTGVNNPTLTEDSHIRIKSGAGFLDARASVLAAQGGYLTSAVSMDEEEQEVALQSGETLRCVLVFDKYEGNVLTSQISYNVFLYLYRNGQILEESNSTRLNTHIIEHTAETSGDYRIVVRGNSANYVRFAAAWRKG